MPRPNAVFFPIEVINRNNLFRNNNNDVRYPLIHMRDHLFHAAFVRVALIYARIFPERERKIIEFILLTVSCLALVLLSYIHMAFVQTPTDCLAHVQDHWPRNGILRVEILKEKLDGKYTLEKSYLREKKIKELEYIDLPDFYNNYGAYEKEDDLKLLIESDAIVSNSETFTNSSSLFNETLDEELKSWPEENSQLPTLAWTDDEYIMEFSLEYGFLKLSPSIRKEYNITVELVTLNPSTDKCFGSALNNLILYHFLGYDEVLLASLKLLAAKEDYKGYVRNVLSEVEFIFVNAWMDKKSYVTAGFVMMVFTISISILLRYSHHQIFVFIVELLHMLEFQATFNFPAGPLLTVILALVGMEAIMSEFFNDTAIAFYVILIVWVADQYDTICCKSFFTKKHWLRFFYLYHFFFYAYSYRFGHNRFLALTTSWWFTMHSMFYFFHRYELPVLIARNNPRHIHVHHHHHHHHPPQNASSSNNHDTPAHLPQDTLATNSDRTEASSIPASNAGGGAISGNSSSLSSVPSSEMSVSRGEIGFVSRSNGTSPSVCYCTKSSKDIVQGNRENSNKLLKTVLRSLTSILKKSTCVFCLSIISCVIISAAVILCNRNLHINILNAFLRKLYSNEAYEETQSFL